MSTVAVTNETQPVIEQREIDWIKSLPFFAVHLVCLTAFFTGVSWKAVGLCLALYVIRMFGITAGYHRYFAHRSYRTSRVFQFVLAWIASSAAQKGPLWWASHHRHHHQHSDQEMDVHSPEREGFWWSHVGWILSSKYEATDFNAIKDFAQYPELRWLNRFHVIPAVVLAVACFLLMGWQGLVWGFFISTVLLYHGTFVINSLCHMFGRVRYKTTDTSRNSLLLALITLGEGWHNNHHYYATSTNMGFFWWEIDVSYYTLKMLSCFGLVWEIKKPPQRVLEARG
jgi:stearoyl-CoA desaturase (delta-9 desaturase)